MERSTILTSDELETWVYRYKNDLVLKEFNQRVENALNLGREWNEIEEERREYIYNTYPKELFCHPEF